MEINRLGEVPGRILLGMSGGMDSYFSALLLRNAGAEVIGATLIFSENTDVEAARRASEAAGIELVVRDCREIFDKKVKDGFAMEYHRGRTPNPCVLCNRYVKMQTLYELSRELMCDAYSSGHYAGKKTLSNGRFAISAASDAKKDQSYMLCRLTQEEINFFFPVLFSESKERLKSDGQLTAGSPHFAGESQDICFIPDGDYTGFVLSRCGESKKGFFTDEAGKRIAEHKGIANYTVGQRKGLGVALGYPAYVTDIDPVSGNITLSSEKGTYMDTIDVSQLCFQGLEEDAEGIFEFDVKIRYAAPMAKCSVRIENGRARACFEKPQKNPAPGQAAVFYRDGVIMFSGFIDRHSSTGTE